MTATDYRNKRMEDAIEKLTEVSSDLNKVIAVHEQRLNQQEKQMGNLETVVERRREESEIKLKDVYETIRSEDRNILQELNNMREEANTQHKKLQERITLMEQKIWMYSGAISVLFFLISYGPSMLKLLGK